jgi:hypothetical protein
MALEIEEPICVKVGGAVEGRDLARVLRCRGLSASVAHFDANWQVTINSPHEHLRTVLTDVGVALAAWMEGPPGTTGRSLPHDGRGSKARVLTRTVPNAPTRS